MTTYYLMATILATFE